MTGRCKSNAPHRSAWIDDEDSLSKRVAGWRRYEALAKKHGIAKVFVASVDTPNDEFIAAAARTYAWCRPAAFFTPSTLSTAALESLETKYGAGTFTGIAMCRLHTALV